MDDVKIGFSAKEWNTIRNTQFFRTKLEVTNKFIQIFHQFKNDISNLPEHKIFKYPASLSLKSFKISKGENYQGLPFIILDYPRQFSKHSIFAYRTMFWWGNFISFTLHLQGRAFNSYKKKILSRYNILRKGKFFICVNKAQWDHRYESTNYRLVGKLSAAEFASEINGKSFLKISKKIELPEIVGNSNVMATVTRFGLATYQELLQMIK